MSSFFPPAWLDELRDRLDIVAVVGEYVPLTQKGRDYWGLCPFHGEKTPSFKVDAERQFYHCFGCHAGGDIIRFVCEMDRLDFPDAVRHLAERAHMPLPQMRQSHEDYAAKRTLKEQILEANKKAAAFFHEQLWQPAGKSMLAYLYERGLDDATIRRFGIGATAPGWDALTGHLQAAGYSLDLLQQAGLCLTRDERNYDMFRQRVIFPIINAQGQVLGFGGRALGDIQPKYLNSPDTPVFNKRQGVYGVHLLRKQRNLSRLLLVEGYMDVVALSQNGIEGVVATLGTALAPEQAALLKRYAPQVWISYDGDAAGQNATLRALDILEQAEVPVRVLVMPDRLDPDEMIRSRGKDAFEALVPQHPTLYRMARAQEKYDLSSKEARTAYAIEASALIARISAPVERENCLQQLMLETGFTHEVLSSQVESSPQPKRQTPRSPAAPRNRRLKPEAQDELRRAQRTLLSLYSSGHIDASVLKTEDFDDPLYQRLAESLLRGVKPVSLLEEADEEQERADILEMLDFSPQGADLHALDIAAGCLRQIRVKRLHKQIDEHHQLAATAPDAERPEILQHIISLQKQLKQLETGRKEGSI